ncbi:MAG: hypothetical protein KJO25_05750 [Bacteroidia bacterium]|nr:hypothetical protein [Bacteroidia bacterium]
MIIHEFDFRQVDFDDHQSNQFFKTDPSDQVNNNDLSNLKSEINEKDSPGNTLIFDNYSRFVQNDFQSHMMSLNKELKQNLDTLSYIHYLESKLRVKTSTQELEDIFELRLKMRVKTLRITKKIKRLKSLQVEGNNEPNAA